MGRSGLGLVRAGERRRPGGTPTPSPTPAPFSAIAADGWRATVAAPADLSLLPATVSRQGFDAAGAATTHVDTLYLTKRVRQAYPSHAAFTADLVALSDYVYATDTVAGATNASTETSPRPIANWIMPHRLVVANTVELEIVAFHRNARAGKQVACVVFRATDGTTTVSQTVAAAVVSGRVGDRNAVLSYKASLDISALNAGLITCHAKVYPWIGGSASVLDSAAQIGGREFAARYFLKNAGLAASPPYAYVRTTGNDGTGLVSTVAASAAAAPFRTIKGAIDAVHAAYGAASGIDGAVIRIGNDGGTPFALASAAAVRAQKVAAITITRDPAVPRANARVSLGSGDHWYPYLGSAGTFTAPVAAGAVRFADLAIVRTGAFGIAGYPNALEVMFDDVDYDDGAQAFKLLHGAYAATSDYWFGAAITNVGLGLSPFGSGEEHRLWRGVACDANGAQIEGWLVVGCAFDRPAALTAGASGRTQSGAIAAFNRFMKCQSANAVLGVGGGEDIAGGAAFVQNLVEYSGTTVSQAVSVAADSATGSTAHVILHNNTLAGAFALGRGNLFYDEGATERTHKLMSCKGNIHVQINTKADVYRGAIQSGSDAASRTGNFAYEHGVGCDGEFSQFIDANSGGDGSFRQEYPGLRASIGTSTTTRNDPLFTAPAATTYNGSSYAAGAGGGTYTLQTGSPCLARLPGPLLSHNLAGTARPASADNSGCY